MQSVVARIKAADADIGSNAEMDYRIMDGDGPGMFNITTDEDTQDGVILLLKVRHRQQTGICHITEIYTGKEFRDPGSVRVRIEPVVNIFVRC